nr:MAG TPA: hypothetical protein [Caudoviricetes sp.]
MSRVVVCLRLSSSVLVPATVCSILPAFCVRLLILLSACLIFPVTVSRSVLLFCTCVLIVSAV